MSLDLFSANLTGVVSRSKQIAGTFELIYRLRVWKKFDQISNDYYTPSRFGQARRYVHKIYAPSTFDIVRLNAIIVNIILRVTANEKKNEKKKNAVLAVAQQIYI